MEGPTPVHRRVLLAVAALVLVFVAAAGAWFGWNLVQRSDLERAVESLPASTMRATWTDWSAVRRVADGDGLGQSSTTRDVSGFVERAYELDLTSTSAVVDSTYVLNRRFGFSPIDAEWEIFGQSRKGAGVVMRLGEGTDVDAVESNLRRLGYTPPAEGAGSGGVWAGSPDLVAQIDGALTPVMQNLVVLPEKRLVLMSDTAAYASSSAEVVSGSAGSLAEVEGVADLADAAGEPASAVLMASDFACVALGMAEADEEDQALADERIAEAGGVSPLAGVVLALAPDRSLTVGMHFESEEQASHDLRPRTTLASGEAVGQGGTFEERFRVVEAVADGDLLVMDLEPTEPDLPVLSDLWQGPVLFATC